MPTDKQRPNKDEISEGRKKSNLNLRPFPKGVSGNPKGRPKGETMEAMMRRLLAETNLYPVNGEDLEISELEDYCRQFIKEAKISSKDRIALADRLWPALKTLRVETPSFEELMAEIADKEEAEQVEDGETLEKIGEGD